MRSLLLAALVFVILGAFGELLIIVLDWTIPALQASGQDASRSAENMAATHSNLAQIGPETWLAFFVVYMLGAALVILAYRLIRRLRTPLTPH